VSKDATFLQTKMTFRGVNSGEEFTTSGKRELDPGYLAIYGSGNREEGILELPALSEGQRCRITSLKLRQGATTAPGYLTESELIGLMEKHGIGTDASIPTHINNITVRNYVTLGSGRTLVPTALGVVLVHGYQRIDPALVLPDVRAAIESFCDMIAKGSAKKEHVVSHSLRNFENKFRYFCAHIEAMDSLFEASFSPLAATGKFLSKCGKCSRYMRYIPLKPQRLYCNSCEETYSLPQNGTIKLYKELRCPLDK
jgi:DNA topoisomerase-3